MSENQEPRYTISTVAEMLDVPVHVLRQWEERIRQLKPERDRVNRRWYTPNDVAIARRIKYLIRHEKMGTKAIELLLAQELAGTGRPKTDADILEHIEGIQRELRAMLDLLDPEGNEDSDTSVGA